MKQSARVQKSQARKSATCAGKKFPKGWNMHAGGTPLSLCAEINFYYKRQAKCLAPNEWEKHKACASNNH
jgi:hypothetical protein